MMPREGENCSFLIGVTIEGSVSANKKLLKKKTYKEPSGHITSEYWSGQIGKYLSLSSGARTERSAFHSL